MSKTLSSFRLTEKTKKNLQYLAKKYDLSQSEIIENMMDFLDRPEIDFDFAVVVKSFKIQKDPAYKKFKKQYDAASITDQKIMWKKLMENNFEFE